MDEVCVDDESDACDPGIATAPCPGDCWRVEPRKYCESFGVPTPCPSDMSCVADPASYFGTDPAGICVGTSAVGACAEDPGRCEQGFLCLAGDCAPETVNCWSPRTCEVAAPPPCAFGYAHSRTGVENGVADCLGLGACVPVNTCGCTRDTECPENAVCNRASGHCESLPWQPPATCSLPFDPGECLEGTQVFTMVSGSCVERTYSGCGGNANRFSTLEECLSVCEGRPMQP